MTLNSSHGETKYYLGLDWGKSKVGMAIADDETRIASPFAEVPAENVMDEIEKINRESPLGKIILGSLDVIPLPSSSKNVSEIESFKSNLERRGFEVVYESELFSSKMAQSHLKEKLAKQSSKSDNAEAARIILQSWLDKIY